MKTLSREEFTKLYGSEQLPPAQTPKKGFIKDTLGDVAETGQNVLGSIKRGGKEIASDFGKAVSGQRNPFKTGFDVVGSALGTVSDVVGDVTLGAGKAVLPEFAEKAIGNFVQDKATKIMDSKAIQGLVNKYALLPEDKKQDLRTTGEFFEAFLDIAGLKGAKYLKQPIGNLTKTGIDNAGTFAKKGVSTVTKTKDFVVDTAKGAIKPRRPITQVVGEVIQGKTKDIKSGLRTLTNLDSTAVNTYQDLSDVIQKRISSLSRGVDDVLSQDTSVRKLADLNTNLKTLSGKTVTNNYVEKALDNLQELYTKTDDVVKQQDIADLIQKAKNIGLTKLDVNNIAREYGQEFGTKAFSKLGDPLTSVNAQMFENVRKGVKSVARQGMGSEQATQIDKLISDMYNTQTLVKKNVEAVNKIAQKIQERGLIEKVGWITTKGIDMATGGLARGLVGGLLPRGVGNKVFNALDLEKRLKNNLKLINKALKEGTDDSLINAGKDISKSFKSGATPSSGNPLTRFVNKVKNTPNKQGGFVKNPLAKAKLDWNKIPKQGVTETLPLNQIRVDSGAFDTALKNVQRGDGSRTSGQVEVVMLKDGSFAIEDGHHRTIQKMLQGDKEIKATVYSSKDLYNEKKYLDYDSVFSKDIPKSNVSADLITEAKKYKSAEEFVKAQTEPKWSQLQKTNPDLFNKGILRKSLKPQDAQGIIPENVHAIQGKWQNYGEFDEISADKVYKRVDSGAFKGSYEDKFGNSVVDKNGAILEDIYNDATGEWIKPSVSNRELRNALLDEFSTQEGQKYLNEVIDSLPKNPDGTITAYRIGKINSDGVQSYTLSDGMAKTFSNQGTSVLPAGLPGLPVGGYKDFGSLPVNIVNIEPNAIKAWSPYDAEILVESKFVKTKEQLKQAWNKANKSKK